MTKINLPQTFSLVDLPFSPLLTLQPALHFSLLSSCADLCEFLGLSAAGTDTPGVIFKTMMTFVDRAKKFKMLSRENFMKFRPVSAHLKYTSVFGYSLVVLARSVQHYSCVICFRAVTTAEF